MAATAERMKAMRDRRRFLGLRDVRLTLPDARLASIHRRVSYQVARLRPDDERAALDWIEAVSEFDASDAEGPHAAR